MKNFRKGLLLTAILSTALSVSAQNRDSGADDDSTRVGLGFNNFIADEPSDPNSAVIAPQFCPTENVTWAVGANGCSGTANTANPGVSRTVTATGVNSGSATFTCSGATNTFTGPNAGATCVAPPPQQLAGLADLEGQSGSCSNSLYTVQGRIVSGTVQTRIFRTAGGGDTGWITGASRLPFGNAGSVSAAFEIDNSVARVIGYHNPLASSTTAGPSEELGNRVCAINFVDPTPQTYLASLEGIVLTCVDPSGFTHQSRVSGGISQSRLYRSVGVDDTGWVIGAVRRQMGRPGTFATTFEIQGNVARMVGHGPVPLGSVFLGTRTCETNY